jgi:hypothetical protein
MNMPTQHEIRETTQRQMMEKFHTFVEIQQGPNPITPDELRKLAERRPALWAAFVPKR